MNRFGFLILLAWLGLSLLLLDTAPAPPAWSAWPADYCRGVNCYCEPIRAGKLVAQPAAAFSNLGFVAVGLLVARAALRRTPAARPGRLRSLVYGGALICAGAFSFFYHASLTRSGDYLDLMGMYLFTSFLMLYNFDRLRAFRGWLFGLAYLAVNLGLALGLLLADDLQQIYFAALILSALIAEALVQRARPGAADRRWLGAALAAFGLGAAVWLLDGIGGLPCWPSAPLTWHAIWHLSAAAAAGLMYVYYRSESPPSTTSA